MGLPSIFIILCKILAHDGERRVTEQLLLTENIHIGDSLYVDDETKSKGI